MVPTTVPAVELVDLASFGPADYAGIVDGETDPFETEHLAIVWRDKTGHVGLTDEGRLVAHAGWVDAQVHTTTGPLMVSGLGGVIVNKDRRGHGVGALLVSGAMERMAGAGPSIGMLFCLPERLAFYQRLGWSPVAVSVTADQPSGPITVPMVTCWTPLVEGALLPPGALSVEGLPF